MSILKMMKYCVFFSAFLLCSPFFVTLSFVAAAEQTLYQRMEMVLKYGHSQQIRDALNRVPELKKEEQLKLIPVFKDLLSLDDYAVQKNILDVIAEASWQDLDSEVAAFLDSPYDAVFYSATNAIKKKQISEAMQSIEEKLRKADYTKEDNKILTLIRLSASLKDNSLVDFFNTQMQDKKNHIVIRREIFRYMGDLQIARPDITAYLTDTALNEKESVSLRAHAVYALSKTGDAAANASFKKILSQIDAMEDVREKRKYASLRSQLFTALARSGDKEVLDILIKMTKSDDAAVRIRAIRELGKLNKKEAVELIRYKSQYDPDINVQTEAHKALKLLESKGLETKEKKN